ncbi:MAG: thiamine pyrophosphate-dependent enzyme [Alphaproteobacteria bacterium]|jgi:thiamine pyrophosphate-dependent acetolactate synthase large subunit-like protein|nr:thiamine pyrophosphate-dependent enzyme [Alphaproteobacteria bacterium]
MSSKPGLRLGPDTKVADGVLERRHAVSSLIGDPGDTLFISGLAGSKDDVLSVVGADSTAAFTLSGAMGAAVAMGLGLALAQPDRKVVVVTGDGELLMNVGTLASVGVLNPPNLSIICVDNEHYGETGWQESHTGRGVDIAKMAEGGCIPNVRTVTKEAELAEAAQMLSEGNGTSFVLVKVAPTKAASIYRSRDASWHKGKFREALLGTN